MEDKRMNEIEEIEATEVDETQDISSYWSSPHQTASR